MNRRYTIVSLICVVSWACVACSANRTQYGATIEPTHGDISTELDSQLSEPTDEETSPLGPTAGIDSRTPIVVEQTSTEAPTPIPALSQLSTTESDQLSGPLALVIIERPQQSGFSAAIFDPQKAIIRAIDFQDERPSAANWIGNGCEIFLNGKVYDLHGNVIWQVPTLIASEETSFYVDRLSPQKNWLASPVFSGPETYDSTEIVNVKTISLAPPFSSYSLSQQGGAEANAFIWSPDEQWVYFSDFGANGVLQIMRATPDGQIQEQLTRHEEVVGQINSLAISPDGRYLAYGILQNHPTVDPYQYAEADEGWIGIIDVDSDSVTRVRLPKFGGVLDGSGLWWSAAGDELLVVGDSLPIPNPDPVSGTQIHWIRVDESNAPYRTIYDADVPGGTIGWIIPASADLNTLFLNTRIGYFLVEKGEFNPYDTSELFVGEEGTERIINFIPSPTNFPGETVCGH